MEYYIGVDIGGTNLKAGVVDSFGKILGEADVPTGADRPQEIVLQDIFKVVKEAVKNSEINFDQIKAVGLGSPVMIDPRGYFGTTELYGDTAYDWVKIYYSVVGNYDQFNLKRFRLKIEEDEVFLDIESNHWEDMEEEFFALLGGEVTPKQMKLLHAIIWLSLTTYAWEDYDSICGAYYNGLIYLEDAMVDL